MVCFLLHRNQVDPGLRLRKTGAFPDRMVKETVLSTSIAMRAGTVAFKECSSTFRVTIFSTP